MTQLCNYDNESLEMLRKSVSLLYELRNSKESFSFGAYTINVKEIFYITPLTFAFVNISPILPGHILVSPRRVVSVTVSCL
jgi:bis(5'-adenosyl)-triphosphatase